MARRWTPPPDASARRFRARVLLGTQVLIVTVTIAGLLTSDATGRELTAIVFGCYQVLFVSAWRSNKVPV